jgi:hypothetical protein
LKILILNWDYDGFLRQHYQKSPQLRGASYEIQMKARNDSLFGVADYYSRNFKAAGHEAAEIHVNNPWLQSAWAREHGHAIEVPLFDGTSPQRQELLARAKRKLRPYKALLGPLAKKMRLIDTLTHWQSDILLAQIEHHNPDIVLNQSIGQIGTSAMRAIRRKGRVLIAQIGVDPPLDLDLSVFDLGISQIPWVVEHFRANGLRAERQHLAFEPALLEKLDQAPVKDIELSFVGSLAPAHKERVALLEAIAGQFNLGLWTPDLRGIPASSPLHGCLRGQVYGRDMYDIIRRSHITLNSHINVARGSATNMRLFEATGAGSFLLTDSLNDLSELFAPGTEVAAYESIQDCLNKTAYYLKHADEAADISRAGQQRTSTEHTYRNRIKQLLNFIERAAR